MVFIPPGEPWRNPYVESFNDRLRDECLHQFWSLTHARVVIGDWKHEYNWHRPHSALDYQPPARLRRHLRPPINPPKRLEQCQTHLEIE
jgi:putative transposase